MFEEKALRGREFQGEKAPVRPNKKSGWVIIVVERIGKLCVRHACGSLDVEVVGYF